MNFEGDTGQPTALSESLIGQQRETVCVLAGFRRNSSEVGGVKQPGGAKRTQPGEGEAASLSSLEKLQVGPCCC